jgi:hypothetical protein
MSLFLIGVIVVDVDFIDFVVRAGLVQITRWVAHHQIRPVTKLIQRVGGLPIAIVECGVKSST